jgi:predicted Rdx family selenoprotein
MLLSHVILALNMYCDCAGLPRISCDDDKVWNRKRR